MRSNAARGGEPAALRGGRGGCGVFGAEWSGMRTLTDHTETATPPTGGGLASELCVCEAACSMAAAGVQWVAGTIRGDFVVFSGPVVNEDTSGCWSLTEPSVPVRAAGPNAPAASELELSPPLWAPPAEANPTHPEHNRLHTVCEAPKDNAAAPAAGPSCADQTRRARHTPYATHADRAARCPAPQPAPLPRPGAL